MAPNTAQARDAPGASIAAEAAIRSSRRTKADALDQVAVLITAPASSSTVVLQAPSG